MMVNGVNVHDEMIDVDFVFDVSLVSAVYLNKGTTVIRSRNVTRFMGLGLGS